MPDWDKINMEKRRSIALCEARNGAILLLKHIDLKSDEWNTRYKEIVRTLFKLNMDLDHELIENNKK